MRGEVNIKWRARAATQILAVRIPIPTTTSWRLPQPRPATIDGSTRGPQTAARASCPRRRAAGRTETANTPRHAPHSHTHQTSRGAAPRRKTERKHWWKVESEVGLSVEEKNCLCELPPPTTTSVPDGGPQLGPVGGEIGPLHESHGLVISARNLRRWYEYGFGEWLHGCRLFSLAMNGLSEQEGVALLERNCKPLQSAGLLDLARIGGPRPL